MDRFPSSLTDPLLYSDAQAVLLRVCLGRDLVQNPHEDFPNQASPSYDFIPQSKFLTNCVGLCQILFCPWRIVVWVDLLGPQVGLLGRFGTRGSASYFHKTTTIDTP